MRRPRLLNVALIGRTAMLVVGGVVVMRNNASADTAPPRTVKAIDRHGAVDGDRQRQRPRADSAVRWASPSGGKLVEVDAKVGQRVSQGRRARQARRHQRDQANLASSQANLASAKASSPSSSRA